MLCDASGLCPDTPSSGALPAYAPPPPLSASSPFKRLMANEHERIHPEFSLLCLLLLDRTLHEGRYSTDIGRIKKGRLTWTISASDGVTDGNPRTAGAALRLRQGGPQAPCPCCTWGREQCSGARARGKQGASALHHPQGSVCLTTRRKQGIRRLKVSSRKPSLAASRVHSVLPSCFPVCSFSALLLEELRSFSGERLFSLVLESLLPNRKLHNENTY